jgi:hypothetical protein
VNGDPKQTALSSQSGLMQKRLQSVTQALTYASTAKGTRSTFDSLSKNVRKYRQAAASGQSGQTLRSRLTFDDKQREQATKS